MAITEAERKRRLRASAKRRGRCIRCHNKMSPADKHASCNACIEVMRAWRKDANERGVCSRCGIKLPEGWGRGNRCALHLDYHRIYGRIRRSL